MVLPFRVVSTSPGLMAEPPGMFSVIGARRGDGDPAAEGGDGVDRGQHRGGPAHVGLHGLHAARRLQRQAAGVEGDALAHQGQVGHPTVERVRDRSGGSRPGRAGAVRTSPRPPRAARPGARRRCGPRPRPRRPARRRRRTARRRRRRTARGQRARRLVDQVPGQPHRVGPPGRPGRTRRPPRRRRRTAPTSDQGRPAAVGSSALR